MIPQQLRESLILTYRADPAVRATRSVAWGSLNSRGAELDELSSLGYWHLLSLDAPTVATLWTWYIAVESRVQLTFPAILSVAVAVWLLYVADRLVDARALEIDDAHPSLEARHYFHYRYRKAFTGAGFVAVVALSALVPHLEAQALHLYLVLGVFVFGYFVVIHASQDSDRFPKEIAVGCFFAAATFIPTVAQRADLRLWLLPPAFLFAMLCSLNCLFIYAWEHEQSSVKDRPHKITARAIRSLSFLTVVLIGASVGIGLFDRRVPWPLSFAVSLAAITLLALNRHRRAIAPITLRAAADLALTTPLLFVLVPFVNHCSPSNVLPHTRPPTSTGSEGHLRRIQGRNVRYNGIAVAFSNLTERSFRLTSNLTAF